MLQAIRIDCRFMTIRRPTNTITRSEQDAHIILFWGSCVEIAEFNLKIGGRHVIDCINQILQGGDESSRQMPRHI